MGGSKLHSRCADGASSVAGECIDEDDRETVRVAPPRSLGWGGAFRYPNGVSVLLVAAPADPAGGAPAGTPGNPAASEHLIPPHYSGVSGHFASAAAEVSRSCSCLASSADTNPISTRSNGLMKPSLIRNPPARITASRNGTAQ